MSIKAMIDEIDSKKAELLGGEMAMMSVAPYNRGLQHAIDIINKHLEGMVIVPENHLDAALDIEPNVGGCTPDQSSIRELVFRHYRDMFDRDEAHDRTTEYIASLLTTAKESK